MQLFVLIPFFPFIVMLAPIFLAINFKIEQYKLMKLSHKPSITQFENVLFYIKWQAIRILHCLLIQCYNDVHSCDLVDVLCNCITSWQSYWGNNFFFYFSFNSAILQLQELNSLKLPQIVGRFKTSFRLLLYWW